jgi:hypothetical protein
VPRLVVAALLPPAATAAATGVALSAMDNGWRPVLVTDERIAFRADPALPVAGGTRGRLAADGGVPADFFHALKAVAS